MTARPLHVGERVADFVLSAPTAGPQRFYAHAGGEPTVLVFDAADGYAGAAEVCAGLAARDIAVRLVTLEAAAPEVDYPTWLDPDGHVHEGFGIDAGQLTAVVLDANLRVLGIATGAEVVQDVQRVMDAVVDDPDRRVVTSQAPVLFVPRALDEEWCQRLIDVWREAGNVATGVGRGSSEVLDDNVKRRRDHTVTDPTLLRALTSTVGRTVFPEVERAFAFRATRLEGFKIACYDAGPGGYFRPHRDNLTPTTAHRVFALTLNLNEDYEGGQLRFPEFGRQLYRPSAGTALVFSCAHLHEVLDATAGQRYVLLSFLYAEGARQQPGS